MSDERLSWLSSELDDPRRVGGKAASLPRLAALGLRVPPAVAVTDRLRQILFGEGLPTAIVALPEDFVLALQPALRALGGSSFSVRSSFALEDDPEALAAGVFESLVDVPAPEVPQAIARVLASGGSEAARAYAHRQAKTLAQGPFAILIHPFIQGDAAGHVAAGADGPVRTWVRDGSLPAGSIADLEALATRVAARLGPSELEWVKTDTGFSFLQWRPYKAATAQVHWQPQEDPPSPLAGDAEALAGFLSQWRWDASHNPHPLSPAQRGLVEAMSGCRIGYEQRVLGGYLFFRAAPDAQAAPLAPSAVQARLDEISHALDRDRRVLEQPPSLAAALATFRRHYEPLLGEVGHAVRAGRRRLERFVADAAPACVPQVPALLAALPSAASARQALLWAFKRAEGASRAEERWAAYLEAFGDEAPAWDVAVPTARERPAPSVRSLEPAREGAAREAEARFAQARARVQAALPPEARATFDTLLSEARLCAAAGENDDAVYARLQAPVRAALVSLGRSLVEAGHLESAEDVFFLPLTLCLAIERGTANDASPENLKALVRSARALMARQIEHPPPAPDDGPPGGTALRGHGTGGRAQGRVFVYDGRTEPPEPNLVLVARTLLPTQLPLLEAAALVTETGGPLDHVAAQARERGLPAVVGVAGALARLRPFDLVVVDGERGLVTRLNETGQEPKAGA